MFSICAKENGPETLRQQRPALTTMRKDRTMDYAPLPPVEYLRQCFSYDPETGVIVWRERPREMFPSDKGWRIANVKCAGKAALNTRTQHGFTGNLALYIDGQRVRQPVKTARVAYALHHGRDPDGLIDHISGDCYDNRIHNLRIVDRAGNSRNRARCQNSPRAYPGVFLRKGGWSVVIGSGPKKWLGTFRTEAEAMAARRAAERKLGFHPNHGRAPIR